MTVYKFIGQYKFCGIGISFEWVQDLQKCQEVLLGTTSGQQSELNLPCPGMFQERKQSNFFQVTFLLLKVVINRFLTCLLLYSSHGGYLGPDFQKIVRFIT